MPPLKDLEVLPWQQLVPELVTVINSTEFTGYFVLVLVFVAAIAGIANTLMMSTFERMHEFGMLLSLGCRPLRIVVLIVMEACLVAILGVALGTVLGYTFVEATQTHGIDMASWGGSQANDIGFKGLTIPLNIFPRLQVGDPVLGLVAIFITSLLASIWPTWIAARLEPMEALRK
jgi:ABC-type lipoprotein release transport system permease subunit